MHPTSYGRLLVLSTAAIVFITYLISPATASPSLLQQAIHSLSSDHPQTIAPPASVEIAFSPNGGATELVIKAIGAARKSVHVAAYSFTSHPIANALIAAHQAGVDVAVVLDHEQIERGNHSIAPVLVKAGIPVHIDITHTLQHNKYMVIDDIDVETGSFNYTFAAEQHNAENVIVLWNAPQLAAAYTANWNELWKTAENYSLPR